MAPGLPQSDVAAGAGECRAYVTVDGRVAESFMSQGGTTAGSLAEVGATPGRRNPEHVAAPPTASLYAGLPTPAHSVVCRPWSYAGMGTGTF